jgi:hypothetical protein
MLMSDQHQHHSPVHHASAVCHEEACDITTLEDQTGLCGQRGHATSERFYRTGWGHSEHGDE